ncbi:helix-turn-helix domain-containing protein [Chengkuizengella sediminis]|uniref:helix-turn-helix domain-containing protein n=1 Tax=Chengkuizengella sediminis TaxID=1885917 RepID=UPI00138A64C2|nr:helix-turn-helix transcriptional regulator [Chengkuizengella sediminis]NDI34663.1 helix-turn-helix transcriptional regulator [Chengkuizengella sediminis]
MFGLGKNRSDLGKYLDRDGLTQDWLKEETGLNKNTVGDLCSGNRSPNARTMGKIIKALRERDPSVRADQFWDL